MIRSKLNKRVIRFIIVGICNAIISFGLLNLFFYKLNQSKIVSSIIATICALIFSFILNREFVFGDKTRRPSKQIVAFVIVTIFGSVIVLNLVYILSIGVIKSHQVGITHFISDLTSLKLSASFIEINLSTALGAVVAMAWNYNGYKFFVFKGAQTSYIVSGDEQESV